MNLMHENPIFDRKFANNLSEEDQKTSLLLEQEMSSGILLVRHVFTVGPPRIVDLWYKPKKGVVMVRITRIKDGFAVEFNYKIKKLRKNIPLIQIMLRKKMYKDVGRRVLACYGDFLRLYTQCKEHIEQNLQYLRYDHTTR